MSELPAVEPASRRAWLEAQLEPLRLVARGDGLGIREEARALYGLEPRRRPEDDFAAAHRSLDALLPGSGALAPRYRRWLEETSIQGDKVVPVLRRVCESFAARARGLVGLPDGETVEVELVSEKPWRGFSGYLGSLKSSFLYNGDIPLPSSAVAFFTAHESYPGHHTEDVWKDTELVRSRGYVEFTVSVAVGAQSVIAEGIAQVAADLFADEAAHEAVAEAVRAVGLEYDADLGRRVAEATRPLADLSSNVALLYDDGAARGELFEYVRTWSLQSDERVERTVDSLERRPFRAYTFCYTDAYRLCADFVGGDIGRFKRLLTEQLVPDDLRVRN